MNHCFWLLLTLIATFQGVAFSQQKLELCEEAGTLTKNADGSFYYSSDLRYGTPMDELTIWMKRLDEALRAEGVLLVLVPTPRRGMVNGNVVTDQRALDILEIEFDWDEAQAYYHDYVASLAPTLGIDLLGAAISLNAQVPGYQLKLDRHWTPEGARVSAEAVARTLLAHPAYKALSPPAPTAFVTTAVGRLEAENRIFYLVEEKCGNLPESLKEMQTLYETEPVAKAQDLFASSVPFVTLVGTSFSQEEYNFAGFLSEALGQDVLNSSVSAGGLYTSLADYLLNRTPETSAKVIIWEYRISDANGASIEEDFIPFRQMIPSVYGACDDKSSARPTVTPVVGSVLAAYSSQMSGPTFTILENTSRGALYGDDYYLQLQASDLALVEFELTLRYQDGSVETLPIVRSTQVGNSGRYYLELSREIASPLVDVSMRVPAGIGGTIEAQICSAPQ